jgi:hypothetical protein
MTRDERVDWTAAQCAEWWRKTHVMDQLEVQAVADGRFVFRSQGGVDGVVVELRAPDGAVSARAVDLPAGVAVTV